MLKRAFFALMVFMAVGFSNSFAQDKSNTIYLDTKDGRVVIDLRADLAPKHASQIKALTKRGFYDGIVFHRVIDGFMAQAGDPTGTGAGGSDKPNVQTVY